MDKISLSFQGEKLAVCVNNENSSFQAKKEFWKRVCHQKLDNTYKISENTGSDVKNVILG